MKRFLFMLLVLALLGGTAYAGTVSQEILAETTLDDTAGCCHTRAVNVQDYSKVAFFVVYDEVDLGAALSLTMYLQISYDGVTWTNTSFNTYNIGSAQATVQSVETMACPRIYYCWIDRDLTIPQVRLVFSAVGEDATHIATVSASIVGIK